MKMRAIVVSILLAAFVAEGSFLDKTVPEKVEKTVPVAKVAAKEAAPVVAAVVTKADDADDAEVADDDSKRVLTKEEQKEDAEEDSDTDADLVESDAEKKADAEDEAAEAKEAAAEDAEDTSDEAEEDKKEDAADAQEEASFSQVAPKPVVAVATNAKKILEQDEDAEAEVAVDKEAKAKKTLEQDEDAEAEVAVDKEAKAKAAKVAPKPVVAVAKPAAKVETKPVVAKPVVAKAVAKVAVPKAAVAVTVSHKEAKPHSVHEHAEMAKKSADEAQHHLEMAKKAFEKTKTNVKEILKTGKKIEHTAGDIHTLYKPPPTKAPKPAKPSESGSISSAMPAVFALLFTVVLANC